MAIELLAVVGPTACGKTRRAVELAKHLDGEIISGDSRQVYRGMDLGTGKDIDEYGEVPVHLIDVAPAGEKYNLHRYLRDFRTCLGQIKQKKRLPILCGGSGLYVESALSGVELPDVPENKELRASLEKKTLAELETILAGYKSLHNTTDTDNPRRAIRAIEIEDYLSRHPEIAAKADRNSIKPLQSLIIGLDIPREERRNRITQRLQTRLGQGMLSEVEQLLASGIKADDLIYYGLEYKYLTLHVIGKISYDEMFHSLETAIHQFAKRQMTWFRGMERRGLKINWLPFDLPTDDFVAKTDELMANGS